MPKTIAVVGFGPGISAAVAKKFGAEGFSVALVARNKGLVAEEGHLAEGVATLKAEGITAAAFPADAGNPDAIATALGEASAADVWGVFDVAVVGEVMIAGTIQGTPWDTGNSIDPKIVTDKFWELYQARAEIRARVS